MSSDVIDLDDTGNRTFHRCHLQLKWHVVDGFPQDLKIKMEQVSKKECTLKMYH